MISRVLRAFWEWYYRRQIDSEGGLMFYDGMLKVIKEREHATATQPKVGSFLEIPPNEIWSTGLKFDQPDSILQWTSTYEDFKRDILLGNENHTANAVFLGFNFRYVGANYSDIYLWPHRGQTLTSIYLIGPSRPPSEVIDEFNSCAERLLRIFGPAATEEEVDFFLYPKHTKRSWITPSLKIDHLITDMRDGDPANRLFIQRRHSKAYCAKYPNSKQ